MTGRQSESRPRWNPAASDPCEWLDRHGDYLYRYAVARTRRSDAAEDLVQETLLAAWRGRKGFAGHSTERTWLTAILNRKLIDWLRRRVRDRQAAEAEAGRAGGEFGEGLFTKRGKWKTPPAEWRRGDPADAAEQAEFWAVMQGCLGKLPAAWRDAFALRYLDETAGEEVCDRLGISPANLWTTLHRARLRVWDCLTKNWFGGER